MASNKFSSTLVGRFYSSGSMRKLSVDMSRAAKHQERRRDMARLFAEEQMNIEKEQEILHLLERARRIDKRRRARQRKSSAIKLQWYIRRFIKRLKHRKCCTIQNWCRERVSALKAKEELKLQRAAVLLMRAVLLKQFIAKWHRSRNVAIKLQKLYRFKVWYMNELNSINEKRAKEQLYQTMSAQMVSRLLHNVEEACLRYVIEGEAAVIIQKHWRLFMYKPIDEGNGRKKNTLKFPISNKELLFLQRCYNNHPFILSMFVIFS